MNETLQTPKKITVAHGGRVYEAARNWGIDPEEVTDFSANINPLGPPPGVVAAIKNALTPASLRAYPDAHGFVSALADKHRLMPDQIVVGSGTASLLFAVLHALRPRRVLVLEPAFSEYDRACGAVEAEVTSWLLEEDGFAPDFAGLVRTIAEHRFDLIILNSPHNPTGALHSKESLVSLINAAEANNTAVLLDEAFIDYAPQASLVSLAAQKAHLIVLRSLTKFYAMPGVRIGYAVCGAELAARIRAQIDPWSVATVALEAGRAALKENEFEVESRDTNASAREEFAAGLRSLGLNVFPAAANFLLARVPRGSGGDLQSWLAAERILIRRCDSFRGLSDRYIRLAVRTRGDNERLVALIGRWISGVRVVMEEEQ